jgi:myo-inositol-1(or 4)-monophosphatase
MSMYGQEWVSIIKEISFEIRKNIFNIFPRKPEISVRAFKQILDLKAQEIIVSKLRSYDASVKLVSEEGDAIFGDAEYTMIADPIDGTTNLARGLSPAVTSLLVSATDQFSGSIASIIVDLFTGKTYLAERHKGAFLENKRLKPSEYRPLKQGLISIDISKRPNLEKISKLLEFCNHLRSIGCSAMSLCQIAEGVLDAHIDMRGSLRNTDIAASLMILVEAGGVYAINGKIGLDLDLSKMTHFELIAASNEKLLNEIIDFLS